MNAKAAVEGKRKSASPDISSSRTAYPRRNIDQLHCPSITYLCAIGALPQPINNILAAGQEVTKPCVPCAYKICNFDIALDTDFTKRIPNQRPEQCPRSSSSGASLGGGSYDLDGTMGYRRGMNVLTVGDGDFTFSSAVARLVIGDGNSESDDGTNKKGMVVATSYEDSQTLRRIYPDFDNTLECLKSCGEGKINVIIG